MLKDICWVLTRARAFAAALWAFVTTKAIPPGKDGDAREAAGFSDGWPEGAVGAVWVSAAPRPWLQALHVTVCAALTTAGCPAGALTVTSKNREMRKKREKKDMKWPQENEDRNRRGKVTGEFKWGELGGGEQTKESRGEEQGISHEGRYKKCKNNSKMRSVRCTMNIKKRM